jgi:hypothetical protein
MSESPWAPIANKFTPFAALGPIVQRLVDNALDHLREQLANEEGLTPRGIDIVIARARPHVEQQTRRAIASAWINLQLDGAATH